MLDRIDIIRRRFIAEDISNNVWLLRRGVYFSVFLYFFILLFDADFFFGEDGLTYGYMRVYDHLEPLSRLLYTETLAPYYLVFFAGLFGAIIIAFWKPKLVRLAGFFVYFFAINLFNKVDYIGNGSVTVTCLMLIYLLFMSEEKGVIKDEKLSYLDVLLSNTAFRIAQFQVCVIYLTAGIYKLSGEQWIMGTAFYYTLSFEFLSQKSIANFFFRSDLALYAANYIALGYQLLFPVLVWFSSIKKWLILAGLTLHLGIIVINGLVDFGLIMIVCYSLFLSNKTIGKIRDIFR